MNWRSQAATIALIGTLTGTLALSGAAAQEPDASTFPNRPIHIVVPFPAGGPADLVSRLIGQKMTEAWGQPVIIDNRPGANTIIGAQAVARAAPDGYTLLMAIDSTLVMNQFMHKSLPYDPFNDFAPITLTTKTVSVLAVRADGPRTVAELMARAISSRTVLGPSARTASTDTVLVVSVMGAKSLNGS